MREIPGVDDELLERLYLLASAKAQLVAAESLLREAISNLEIAGENEKPLTVAAARAVMELRERVFVILENAP